MATLCDKYKATCFADIKGQELAILKLKSFIRNFPIGKRAVILHGPPGSGKTSLAYSLASETNSEIIEMNASDLRNKDSINGIIGNAVEQKALFKKQKILLLDEIDGISKDDRGGLQELLLLIDKTNFPILMTANNIWDKKFSLLRQKSEMIYVKNLDYQELNNLLSEVSKKESLQLSPILIDKIAIKSKGDVRAALNDLQAIESDTNEIDERDTTDDIFIVLKQILQNKPSSESMELFDHLEMPLDEILLWLEENAPLEYKGEELYKAFDALSMADVFKGRIYRQQHWRFLVYQNFLMSYGVAAAKTGTKTNFTKYKRPTRILKIWMINQKKEKLKRISIKYAKFCHISIKRAMKDFRLIAPLLKNDYMFKKLRLEEDEIDFLKDYTEGIKIQNIS